MVSKRPKKMAGQLLKEIANRDPEAHARVLAQAYGGPDMEPQRYPESWWEFIDGLEDRREGFGRHE